MKKRIVSNQKPVRNRQRPTSGFQIQSSFAPFINMRNFDCLPHVRPAPRNYLHTQRVSPLSLFLALYLSLGIYILSVPLRAERESLGLHIDVIARLVYANGCDDEWEPDKNLTDARRAQCNFLFFSQREKFRHYSRTFNYIRHQRFY